MDKNIKINKDARTSIVNGVNKLADVVKTTMGAKGKLVVIEDNQSFFPILSKDGITVAEHVILEDQFENLGAKMLKQATKRTLDEVQDSTTTATVLAQALINNGIDKQPRQITEAYQKDLELTIKELKKTVF